MKRSDKQRELVLPMCRCITCKREFEQPSVNYIWLDCPTCHKKSQTSCLPKPGKRADREA